MATTAAKGVKARGLGVVLALLGALLLIGAAEASRYLPGPLEPRPSGLTAELAAGSEIEPEAPRLGLDADRFLSFAALSDVGAADTAGALPRFRLHALDAVCAPSWGRKSAYRRFSGPGERIYLEVCDLGWKPHQGESFLQPDPLGPVDSPNLYQAFGYDAFNVTDPMGRNVVDPERVLNPQYRHFEFEGAIYGVSPTTLAVGQQTPGGYRTLNPNDSTDAETIAVIRAMYMGGVSLPPNYQASKALQGISRRLTDDERRQTVSDLIGVTPVASDVQDFAIVWSGRNPVTGEELGPWGYSLTVAAAALPAVSAHTTARLLGKNGDEALEAGADLFDPRVGRMRDPHTGRFIADPANPPSPYVMTDSERRAAWRRLAEDPDSPLTELQRQEIRERGWRGPRQANPRTGEVETMELSHEPIPLREGGREVVPRWPDDHAAVDPHRHPKRQL